MAIRERAAKPAPGEQPAAGAGGRRPYLDRIKVGLVGLIIMSHAWAGYAGLDGAWPYQPVREVRLSAPADGLLELVELCGVLFAMGLFFLVSGLLTPNSLRRKGTGRFIRDRLWRLGVPFAVWVLVLWPLLIFGMHRMAGSTASYWSMFVHAKPFLDTGPMWFVELLLLFSIGYALLRRFVRRPRPVRVSASLLVGLGVAVAVGSFVVRLWFPFLSFQVLHVNLSQWPQYLALFGLGIVAVGDGWLDVVPDGIRRGCAVASVVGVVGVVALFGLLVVFRVPQASVLGGWNWMAAGLAVVEGVLAVAASVWSLAFAQRHLNRPQGTLSSALSRSAYAAFIVQSPVLIGLALLLRGVVLPAEVKASVVALAGLAASYGVAWLLVTRTPLGRIL